MRSAPSLPELASPLEIAAYSGDFESLAAPWAALADPAHPGAAFRSWAWSSAWWKMFSARREPFVLVARQGAEILGLLPLFAESSPLGGRRLAFIGEGIVGSDYLGVVCRAGDEERLARLFAGYCATAQFDQLSLDGLLDSDPLVTALTTALPPARSGATVEPRYLCPRIGLDGDFDTYAAELPDGTGPQWRRRLRWLEKRPGFAIEEHASPDAVVAGLDALFSLHHQRWAVDGGSDAIDGPAVEAFHRLAARALAERGWARLFLLSVEGAPRAALYGFRHGDRFAFYQAGYDPAFSQRSVGTVLLGDVVRRCFADGVREFDFLRGSEPYKLKWANGSRHTVRLRAHDGSLRARLHDTGRTAYWRLREAGKRALPAGALEWARRARKQVAR